MTEPQRIRNVFFLSPVENPDSSATNLENRQPFSKKNWVVVRADDGAFIYAAPEWLFDLVVPHLQNYRKKLCGKVILLNETSFHKNIVESNDKPTRTYYTFGNFFGKDALLIENGELPSDFCTENVGKKMKNVVIEFGGEDGIVVKSWTERTS